MPKKPSKKPKKSPKDKPKKQNEKKPEEIARNLSLFDNTKEREISEEMESCYLDYAMSVIVARALPDVRDGLKPVHRRILYAMHEIGLRSTAPFRKSAAVVGEVLGKYHPHGDSAVYESMVRMAQDFSLRYPLVRGQGNFGSIDGDNAAAMRYTEAKMEKITEEMLIDIDKATVKWVPNYDGKYKEPTVLPAKVPQLLLNGAMGIAVGMATNIPPHNLGETIDGTIALIDKPDTTVEELMEFIKGPDFPTKGLIYDTEAIKEMYISGRGGVVMRARAEIVERKSGKFRILITEIPYQVNKSMLVSKIADLVHDKKITGISDIRDESNREGIRVVIELKKDSHPKKILNQLYKFTQMQTTFNMNMIALVNGIQPRLLNLKEALEYFIKHRKDVVTKRTQFELKVAKERTHILEGLKIALDNIDAVIKTIKKSETKEDAHIALMEKFKLSDEQSMAILEMKLQTLAGLERKKIEDEYKEKLALIKELEEILADKQKILDIIKEELEEMRKKYGDERQTEIVPQALEKMSSTDTIPNDPMIVMLTKENYIKRITPSSFRAQARGGKGIIGTTTKETDEVSDILHVKNHDTLLFFTNMGRVFQLPVYELPQTSRTAKGQAIINLLQLGKEEKVTTIYPVRKEKAREYLFMATKNGTVKKTTLSEFQNVRKSGLIAIRLRPGDYLEWVKSTNPGDKVTMITKKGQSIQFNEKDVRPIGRASMGVRGIKIKEDDEVVEMDILKDNEGSIMVITENGMGKKTLVKEYRLQSRGGSGIKTANITARTGKIVKAKVIEEGQKGDLIVISKHGQIIRLNLRQLPFRKRATQGVYIMRLRGEDKVASISVILKEEKQEKGKLGVEEKEEEKIEGKVEEKTEKKAEEKVEKKAKGKKVAAIK